MNKTCTSDVHGTAALLFAINKVSLKENCMHISWYKQGQLAIYETVLTMQNFNSPLLEGILKKLKAIKYGVLTVATKYIGNKHSF